MHQGRSAATSLGEGGGGLKPVTALEGLVEHSNLSSGVYFLSFQVSISIRGPVTGVLEIMSRETS